MTYVIIANPAFAGQRPRLLRPACHDRTPFLSFSCACGAGNHLHESQIEGAPDDAELAFRCAACRQIDVLPIADVRGAFAAMRAEGWYE